MFSGNKISKGGLIGGAVGLVASILTHKKSDSAGKKAMKSGAIGLAGYLLGAFAEKKINQRSSK